MRYRSELASAIIQVQYILPEFDGYVQGIPIESAFKREMLHTIQIEIFVRFRVTIVGYLRQDVMNMYRSIAIVSKENIDAVKGTKIIASWTLQV